MHYSKLPKLLNVHDVGDYFRLTYSEVFVLMEQTSFPVIIIGNTKRVFREDLEKWIKNNPDMHPGIIRKNGMLGNTRVTQAHER